MRNDITNENLAGFRATLLGLRAKLQVEAESTKSGRDTVVLDQQSTGRLTRMDALQNQAMAHASENRRQQSLQKITRALARIEDGTFGVCIECDEPVEAKRLNFDPAIALCLTCARG